MVLNQKLTALILMVLFFLTTPLFAEPTDIQSALKACKNISAQQRQLAKTAGYNIDALCNAATSSTSTVSDVSTPTIVEPRKSAVSDTDYALESASAESNDAPTLGQSQDKKVVKQKLSQFGYDLFAGSPTTFAPVTEIPVLSNYMIGPGDSIKVQLFGKNSESYNLTVSRDGIIQFPSLGPINIAGLTFVEMKRLLTERVEKQMIGVQASITLGDLRSIRIFVLGDANRPGSYTVSSLSSMTNALFVSGGVRKIGSLRNIQLKRQGKIVTRLDLYDLLLNGDTSKDVRLLPGDVIFIPPIGNTAGIAGAVKRPAIYELKNEKSVSDLVNLSGGYLPVAYPSASRLERINARGDRTLVDIDLNNKAQAAEAIVNGDVLQVYSVLDKMENIVFLDGHVYRPGGFTFKEGMKVSDLVGSLDNLLPVADLDYALLVRETQPTRELMVYHIVLKDIFSETDSKQSTNSNMALYSRDRLIVFGDAEVRAEKLAPIIAALISQETKEERTKIVFASGAVKFKGSYPYTANMSVDDLIAAAGGLSNSAYVSEAELTRKDFSNPEQASIKHFSVSLDNGVTKLEAGDNLVLKMQPGYQEKLSVELKGEVKFPGFYEFYRGESLTDIVKRAGGLTTLAHVEAAFFSRRDLKAKEAEQLAEFRERLHADIASAELEDLNSDKNASVSTLNSLLDSLENSKATGRLVINLDAIISGGVEDVILRDGDRLIIPSFRQEVTIIGEVQNPTSHLYNPVSDHRDYIERSGGTTEKADESRIYVIKADGSVFLPEKRGWFRDDVIMHPGDTIVVPIEIDRLDNMTFWTSVSQIIYQMALGAAAVNSL